MNHRLTITAGLAVVLASLSIFAVIQGIGWFYAGIGAVIAVAAAGTATRLSAVPAAIWATILTALAVVPLLSGPAWPARLGGLALVAIVAASASRQRILPVIAHAASYLAALLVYLNLVYAGPESLARLVPSARSLRYLGTLISQGGDERAYSPPVPGHPGVGLLAAGGIGVIAIIVDLLAVRMRRPAIAGLPLLVLFSVPVATNVKDAGLGEAIAFCLGISGYLALLSADGRERLRLWGRLVTFWPSGTDDRTGQSPDTRALAVSGRRIGMAAVGLGLIVPLLLPGLKIHDLFATRGSGQRSGCCAPSLPQPLVQMQGMLHDSPAEQVLSYTTTASDPDQQYLQVYVLNYDSASGQWTQQKAGNTVQVGSGPLAPPPGQTGRIGYITVRTRITMDQVTGYGGETSYLPLPYAPTAVHVTGPGWQESRSTLVVSGNQALSRLGYSVTSKEPDPAAGQLDPHGRVPAAISRADAGYSGADRRELTVIAEQAVRGAATPLEQATDLQDWLAQTGGFTYSVSTSLPNSAGGLVRFLTEVRRGDCQQFSFAMAILARLIGIPSRVAVGFTAGRQQKDGRWLVTTEDAHAWPELYLAGAGWLRFEPTPAGSAVGQGTASAPIYAAVPPPDYRGSSPGSAPQSTSRAGKAAPHAGAAGRLHQFEQGRGAAAVPRSGRRGGGFPWLPVAACLIAALAITPRLVRSGTRRMRWRAARGDADLARAAWRELQDDLADYGIALRPSESARAAAARVGADASLDDAALAALRHIAAAEERARYARAPLAGGSLRAEVALVRRALARNASWPERLRALLMPPSTLDPVHSGIRQLADIFGWLDAAAFRLRRRGPAVPARRAG
ncbi:MAG: transglutaminaseTgpA domain-containing protein [Streptosporangiaceae bacterium]|jgi:transglutaminase-like putative cysteine protease